MRLCVAVLVVGNVRRRVRSFVSHKGSVTTLNHTLRSILPLFHQWPPTHDSIDSKDLQEMPLEAYPDQPSRAKCPRPCQPPTRLHTIITPP